MKEVIPWGRYGIDEVFVAYNAQEARERINSGKVDLMLCDIEMPGESGLSLLKWVREHDMAVECVFLTCHASFEYAREAIQLDCQNYILIPAKYEDIGAAIQKVVTRLENTRNESRLREYGELALRKMVEEAGEKSGPEKDPKKLTQAMKQYILENLGEETLSVASVAEAFFFHPVYMNRVFRKQTGISVSQYIMDERMRLAKQLLESGKVNANVAAQKVGYCNYPNFFAAFRKYYGCTPSSIAQDAQRNPL